MKSIEIRVDNGVIVIENATYPSRVHCDLKASAIDISAALGITYKYLQWSDSIWQENFYIDVNNTVNALADEQVRVLDDVCTKWVQPLGQDGNPTIEQAKLNKKHQYVSEFERTILNMVGIDVTASEMSSWTKQESEARAWVANSNAATPLIDNLIIGRNIVGETKASLVDTIITKADSYAQGYARVLGAYHAKQKAIEVATTVAEVEAI